MSSRLFLRGPQTWQPQWKLALAVSAACAALVGSVPATTVNFSGRTWTTNDTDPNFPPSYTGSGNTGTMTGQYAQDGVMTTPVTLSVGDTISFDSKLTQNAWWSDTGFGFIDNTSLYDSAHPNQRGGKIQRFNQSGWEFYAYDPSGTQQAYWYIPNNSSDIVNYKWTFDSATHLNVTMTVGNNTPVSAGWNISNIADIQAFRAGLWDSQQTSTVSNFKQRPALLTPSGNTYTWNAASGDYTNNPNWLGGVAPTTADNAAIANGGTATVNTANASSGRVLTLEVGNAAGNGTLEVQSGGELFAGNSIRLGISTGTGTVNQTGGLVAIDLGNDMNLRVGFDAGGTGHYNLSGGELWVGDSLTVGKEGTGTFIMSGGWISHAGFITVGRSAGSDGTFNMSAGVVDQTFGDFEVGNFSTGAATLSGGTFNVAPGRAFAIGNRLGGTGTATISGTALLKTSDGGDLFIGGNDNTVTDLGGTGTLNINGGEVQVDDDFIVGNYGTGTLNMTGGLVSKSGWIVMGNNPGANGTFNMSGGTVNQSFGDIEVGDEAPGAINFSGGTINQAAGGWGFFVGNRAAGTGTATINGAAVLNNDQFIVGKAGNGTATISGTADINTKFLSIGNDSGGVGVLHFNAGDINVAGGGDFFVGNSGTGTLDMTGGVVSACGWIVLGKQPGSSGMFNMSGGTVNQSEGDLEIGNGGAGTLNLSGGTLNIVGTVFLSMPAGGTGDANISGGTLNSAAVINNSTSSLDLSGAGTLNTGPIDGSGNMTVAGGATANATHVRQSSLTMTGGTVNIAPTGTGTAAGVSVVANLSISGPGKFNLTDNKLIVKSPGSTGTWNGSAYTGVTGSVASGRNGNAAPLWDGNGIITSQSTATNGNYHSIGVARASDVRPATATATALWAGQTITGTDTLVMYTYGGDATLDGKINIDDYVKIDSGIASGLTGWVNGDFNYDGKVNIDDYTTVIDANIGNQNGVFFTAGGAGAGAGAEGLSGVSAVPEPASVVLVLTFGAAPLLSRRHRRIQ